METQAPPVEEADRIFELGESGKMLGVKTSDDCSVERRTGHGSARREVISVSPKAMRLAIFQELKY
jgi:hypothetical protein